MSASYLWRLMKWPSVSAVAVNGAGMKAGWRLMKMAENAAKRLKAQ